MQKNESNHGAISTFSLSAAMQYNEKKNMQSRTWMPGKLGLGMGVEVCGGQPVHQLTGFRTTTISKYEFVNQTRIMQMDLECLRAQPLLCQLFLSHCFAFVVARSTINLFILHLKGPFLMKKRDLVWRRHISYEYVAKAQLRLFLFISLWWIVLRNHSHPEIYGWGAQWKKTNRGKKAGYRSVLITPRPIHRIATHLVLNNMLEKRSSCKRHWKCIFNLSVVYFVSTYVRKNASLFCNERWAIHYVVDHKQREILSRHDGKDQFSLKVLSGK